jgi:hypothetical protein
MFPSADVDLISKPRFAADRRTGCQVPIYRLGATQFRLAGSCRAADLPRLIEEPAEPRTQSQGPPEGRAMNTAPAGYWAAKQ